MVERGGRNDGVDANELNEYRRRLEELRSFLASLGALFELVLRFGDSGIGKLTRLLSAPAKARSTKQTRTKR